MSYKENISFGFEQTFTIKEWWTDPGFVSESDTPLKREKILDLSIELAKILDGKVKESRDIYNHIQYEVFDTNGLIQYWVTLDPGSIEVKTNPLNYHELRKVFEILFEAAYASELFPYRQWWYGIKGGTEGGTHINMAGKTLDENPFYQNPALVLKYIVFVHNNPCIHYPFMGLDVGPEGNAMRMDEQGGYKNTLKSINDLIKKFNSQEVLSLEDISQALKDTTLMTEKCSMPSLYKFKSPLFLLEDRAQEAFRSAEEVLNIIDMKLAIFKYLDNVSKLENIEPNKNLHQETLTYKHLWDEFVDLSRKIEITTDNYKIFFERQFPLLVGGGHPSDYLEIREGRRPRVITDRKFANGICVSKTIDTRHKRFEFQIVDNTYDIIVTMPDKELVQFDHDYWAYKDTILDEENSKIKVKITNPKNESKEEVYFDIKNMMWD